jgi:hypothetical protein
MRSLQRLAAWYLQRSTKGYAHGVSPWDMSVWMCIYGKHWQIIHRTSDVDNGPMWQTVGRQGIRPRISLGWVFWWVFVFGFGSIAASIWLGGIQFGGLQ